MGCIMDTRLFSPILPLWKNGNLNMIKSSHFFSNLIARALEVPRAGRGMNGAV